MLNTKKALITGGSRGLGKAIALAFAKEGIDVAITGRNKDLLKKVVTELQELGVRATYAIFDIKNREEVHSSLTKLTEDFGPFDILVNNAGISKFGTLLEMEESDWENILLTNVLGMYYVTREILPQMIEKNEGDIFNVSSTAGLAGNPTTSAYSASKFAVIGMNESLMKEVRKNNIRVTTLTPSTIASDMSKQLGLTDGNPESVLQPEDFAELIVATLKLPRRALLKSASLWSTNP
ncbi:MULTISPECIES: 3-ketoacyl-ACP reductase [Weeksella]|uniref:3-oxoacyl-(Acyl-carrier-protein) reductase n=1 Tax=Weeksella virosa (strain ATCC 43766 / DSM 16922 / JCM 21250 / CCUG 30538 / CDC 9751 / IAM 14551 / NBRC 16016 / NCTC 11634 / CL345/78) TaxID=865938 RepID=F0P0P8_WEEVC|nr:MULTISPECIES: 3-ketoacyl-ACP reductase [Weeksella]ADX68547.1 3-oxoacyl-(acyl-carrier-protein) reductase [Weeksella virosa DSM 16922]MDK7375239.1 3-ketoacyl-ACP reductase [Weeksella virosa]MDK7675283.1 3-ketoacyl-ACP reductase [Weeksella virosa]OFM85730.1 3-ketoacyl-ACP reductase [Weeksella sp. HMSC059D05]SUP54883.1 3-oxoacyl-[acyl-carrier-protein] reductase FabG [Weeksella virosa]